MVSTHFRAKHDHVAKFLNGSVAGLARSEDENVIGEEGYLENLGIDRCHAQMILSEIRKCKKYNVLCTNVFTQRF